MQATLDREMPANPRRKRRPAAWMWLMGVFLLTSVGIKDWNEYQQSKRDTVPPANKKQVDASIVVAPAAEQDTKERMLTPVKGIDFQHIPQEESTGQERKTAGAFRANPGISTKGTSLPDILSTMVPKNAGLTNPVVQSPIEGATPSIAQLSGEPTIFLAREKDMALLPILPLAVIPQSETELPELLPLDLPNHPQPNSKLPKPWIFALNSGISTERFVAANGLSAGMSLIWQPLRRLGIRAGATYQTERPTIQSRPIANVSAKNFNAYLFNSLDIIGSSAKNLYVDPSEEVLIPVRRLHQIEFPALIFWQPWKQWRVYAGSTLTRTLYAKSGRYSYVSNQNQYPFSVLEENRSLDELASRQLRTWHIYGNSGFGIQPWKHWGIDFFGQFELPGLKKTSANARYNTSVSEAFSSKSSTKPVYTRFQLSATLFF